MFAGIVGLSILAFIAVMIGTLAGAGANDGFSQGIWPIVLMLPLVRPSDRLPPPHRPAHRERRAPGSRHRGPDRADRGRCSSSPHDSAGCRDDDLASALRRARVRRRRACATSSTSPRCCSHPTPSTTRCSRLDRRHLAVLAAAVRARRRARRRDDRRGAAPSSWGSAHPPSCRMPRPALLGELAAALARRGSPTGACTCRPPSSARLATHTGARHPAGRRARRTRAARAREPSTTSTAACSSAAPPRPPSPPSPRPPSCSPSSAASRPASSPGAASRCPTRKRLAESSGIDARRAAPTLPSRRRGRPRRARRRVLARVRPRRRVDAAERALERWRRLAECWRDRIPDAAARARRTRSETLTATDLRDDVRWFYPAGGRWIDEGARPPRRRRRVARPRGGGRRRSTPGRARARRRHRRARRARWPRTSRTRSTRSTCSTTSRSSSPGPARRRRSMRGCAAIADVEGRDLASTLPRERGSRRTAASPPARSADVDPRVPRRRSRSPASRSRSSTWSARPPARFGSRARRGRRRGRCAGPRGDPLRRRAARAHARRRPGARARSGSGRPARTGCCRGSPPTWCSGRSPTRATRSSPRTRDGDDHPAPPRPARAGTRRRRTEGATRSPRSSIACSRRGDEGATEQAWLARQLERGDHGEG